MLRYKEENPQLSEPFSTKTITFIRKRGGHFSELPSSAFTWWQQNMHYASVIFGKMWYIYKKWKRQICTTKNSITKRNSQGQFQNVTHCTYCNVYMRYLLKHSLQTCPLALFYIFIHTLTDTSSELYAIIVLTVYCTYLAYENHWHSETNLLHVRYWF